jgi:hypothetical protein
LYYAQINGSEVSLTSRTGIELLNAVIERSIDSINTDRYTLEGLHNFGHLVIGMINPDGVSSCKYLNIIVTSTTAIILITSLI